jgi:hypothetical protein
VAHITLRQAIQTWQRRLELTGMGLVETTLDRGHGRADGTDSSTTLGASIDATLACLSRLTPTQFAVELAYPWCPEDGRAGALLGFIPETCGAQCALSEPWSQIDAA